jgi:hypothetical protein
VGVDQKEGEPIGSVSHILHWIVDRLTKHPTTSLNCILFIVSCLSGVINKGMAGSAADLIWIDSKQSGGDFCRPHNFVYFELVSGL